MWRSEFQPFSFSSDSLLKWRMNQVEYDRSWHRSAFLLCSRVGYLYGQFLHERYRLYSTKDMLEVTSSIGSYIRLLEAAVSAPNIIGLSYGYSAFRLAGAFPWKTSRWYITSCITFGLLRLQSYQPATIWTASSQMVQWYAQSTRRRHWLHTVSAICRHGHWVSWSVVNILWHSRMNLMLVEASFSGSSTTVLDSPTPLQIALPHKSSTSRFRPTTSCNSAILICRR